MILRPVETVRDQYQRPLSGAQIYVYNQDGSLATITSDGTTPIIQPIVTDAFGSYSYWATTGYYSEETWFGGKKLWVEANVAVGSPGADLALRSDLAATSGSGLVGWIRNAVGAVSRTLAAFLGDASFNPKDYGAKGDGVLNAGLTAIVSGTDDTAAFTAMFADIAAKGGGQARLPRGVFLVSSYLALPQHTRITGAGKNASIIATNMAGGGGANAGQNVRNGTILYSNWPSNSSTIAEITVEDIGLVCVNAANVGAAFYDNGGARLLLKKCLLKGFKYGAIFDQSEVFEVDECVVSPADNSGAGVWMVNGADLTPGNVVGYTNRGVISNYSFNPSGATVIGIVDDGGNTHSIIDPIFNNGLNAIRTSGAFPAHLIGAYCEAQSGNIIEMSSTTRSGGSSGGGSTLAIFGGFFSAAAGKQSVNIGSGNLTIDGGATFAGTVSPIAGATNAAQLVTGQFVNIVSANFLIGTPPIRKDVVDRRAAVPASGWFAQGHIVFNSGPTAGSILGWRCTVAGNPGTWETIYPFTAGLPGQATKGDADVTLTPYTDKISQRFITTLTANRAVTLATTGAIEGNRFRISRPASGAFNLNVGTGPLKALAAATWCEVEYDGSAWQLIGNGSL